MAFPESSPSSLASLEVGSGAGSTRRRRKAPFPNSILDQKALMNALEDRGIAVKQIHLDGLYQSLHRQHYPPLDEFCENYKRNEMKEFANIYSDTTPRPLKNKVSNRKNRNRQQLPKALLEFLHDPKNGFVTVTSRVAQQKTSGDGMTTKLAIQLYDGQLVESVLMRYVSNEGSRASLCVSSQCGCAMGCTFCATGTMGLSGNLTTGEILEQIVHANRILADEWEERSKENSKTTVNDDNNNNGDKDDGQILNLDLVRNVVFMGMGEPLDNYNNVVDACRALIHRKRWNLAHGRVTISTVGLISQIRRLTKELPEVSLALSLHAPNQEMRTAIVPTATRYPIEKLVQVLDDHMMAYVLQRKQRIAAETGTAVEAFTDEERIREGTRRRAMIEYVMLEGDTSSLKCAHQLGKLCENRHLLVNLIPYNQTNVKDKLKCPSMEHMKEFQRIVTSYGTFCTIRRTMGADIDSACGQLITLDQEKNDSTNNNTNVKTTSKGPPPVVDIEDGAVSPFPADHARKGMAKVKGGTKVKSVTIVDPPKSTAPRGGKYNGWIIPLAVATSLSATCFAVVATLFFKQQARRQK